MDLFIEVPKVKTTDLTDVAEAECSAAIRMRVQAAREKQTERLASVGLNTNAELSSDQVRRLLEIDKDALALLKNAVDRYRLSARAYFRLLKVSQTIADLEKCDRITSSFIAEALQYRQPTDRLS